MFIQNIMLIRDTCDTAIFCPNLMEMYSVQKDYPGAN